jgi:hypothetical protein
VYSRGKHAEIECVIRSDNDELIVRQDDGIEKLEDAMSGRLDGCDVLRQPN